MHLDKLKPAWKQYKLSNTMQPTDYSTILSILDKEVSPTSYRSRIVLNSIFFLLITLFCQGG
jgi:hypothetical protein